MLCLTKIVVADTYNYIYSAYADQLEYLFEEWKKPATGSRTKCFQFSLYKLVRYIWMFSVKLFSKTFLKKTSTMTNFLICSMNSFFL